MRKMIFLFALAFVSLSVQARVGGIKQPRIVVFVDDESRTYVYPSSIQKLSDRAVMWSMVTYSSPQTTGAANSPFLSEKSQDEYDCQGKQFRPLSSYFYRGRMGVGEAVYKQITPGEWQAIEPNTDIEILWNFACGKTNANTVRVTPANSHAGH